MTHMQLLSPRRDYISITGIHPGMNTDFRAWFASFMPLEKMVWSQIKQSFACLGLSNFTGYS